MKIKFRHKLASWLLHPYFKAFFKYKYGYSYKKFDKLKPPFLLLSNYSSLKDALMCSLSFKNKPVFYVADDFIFDETISSRLVQHFASPISINKGQLNLKSIKDILSILKNNGIVGLYPSGSSTYSGNECYIKPSIVKLVKKVNCPVLLFRTDGLYGVDPRWGNKIRKGKSFGEVRKVIYPDDLINKTDSEIYKDIVFHLSPKQSELCLSSYKSKTRAEYLERVLFICPNCETQNNLYSNKNMIYCRHCGFSAAYQEDLTFLLLYPVRNKIERVKDWMDFQIRFLNLKNFDELDNNFLLLEDTNETLYKKPENRKKQLIAKNICVKLYKKHLMVGETEFKLNDISNIYIQNKNMLVFTIDNEKFILTGTNTVNHYKYILYICKLSKNLNQDLEKQQ